jgi:hypothetical protein
VILGLVEGSFSRLVGVSISDPDIEWHLSTAIEKYNMEIHASTYEHHIRNHASMTCEWLAGEIKAKNIKLNDTFSAKKTAVGLIKQAVDVQMESTTTLDTLL